MIHGSARRWPRKQLGPTSGRVVIDVLPEFYVQKGDLAHLRATADQLRRQYATALEAQLDVSTD